MDETFGATIQDFANLKDISYPYSRGQGDGRYVVRKVSARETYGAILGAIAPKTKAREVPKGPKFANSGVFGPQHFYPSEYSIATHSIRCPETGPTRDMSPISFTSHRLGAVGL